MKSVVLSLAAHHALQSLHIDAQRAIRRALKQLRRGSIKGKQLGGDSCQPGQESPQQFGMLKHLGVEIPDGCTKQRASELIDEAKA